MSGKNYRIYLDACSLQRPLDDRSQPRINLEAEAILTILRLIEADDLQLLSSESLEFEIDRIPNDYKKSQSKKMLNLAKFIIEINDEIEAKARLFIKTGIKPMDALHLASASWKKADYFCTCDDKLIKKTQRLTDIGTRVISPVALAIEVLQ